MGGNTEVFDAEGKGHLPEKIDLSKFDRGYVIKEIIKSLIKLDEIFKKQNKFAIWRNKKALTSGIAFNGSTSVMFDPTISDQDFKKYKPMVGDIDLTVDRSVHKPLWELIKKYAGKKLTSNVKIIDPFNLAKYNLNSFRQLQSPHLFKQLPK